MLIAWKSDLYTLLAVEYGIYTISVKLFDCSTGFIGWISCVYGPPSNRGKEEFWIELYDLGSLIEEPWCIGGDFNEVLYLEDRKGRRVSTAPIKRIP